MEVDELDVNPFYRQLQSTHFRLFEKAQNDCCVICVPQKRSLKSDNFSMKFIETHILKSSPYFAGQYVTTNTSKSKTVSLDGAVLRTGDGFEKEITVKILSEEIGYNKEYKPFRILVIEKPLDPHYQTLPGSQSKLDDFLTVKGGFDECKAFLTSYPAYNEAVSSLDSRILKFNTNYMVLPDYLDDAAKRLQNLCSHTIEKCLEETNQKDLNEPQFSDVLNVSVQGFTLRKVHQKVYSAVCERFGSVDGQLLEKCERLKAVGGDQLGVPDVFLCPLPSAVVELANLDNFKTPFEKLKCIKSTLDRIAESVNTHVLENRHPSMSSDDTPCLTTDDLIPILVTVISQARCPHLHSNVFYMENFFWPTSSKNDISYSLVTLKAAVEYIRTTDFSSLLLTKSSHKKELSLDELRDATDKIRLSEGGGNSSQSGSQGAPLSRIDRQLMRISKMLDKSFSEAEKSRKQAATTSIFDPDPPPEVARGRGADIRPVQGTRKEKQNRSLNAPFNDDLFMTSFGKQT